MYITDMISNPFFFIYILTTVALLLIVWIVRLEVKMRRLLRGGDGKSLEEIINEAHKSIAELQEFRLDSIEYFKNVESRLRRSVQSVEMIRFNPFKGEGVGGNQSFCTAFVSEKGDGAIISSLYSRDRVSIFCKPLVSFESSFELSDEEKEVLETAKKNLKN
jgi:hypothetical protein